MLPNMQRRFFLNSVFVIRRLARSAVNWVRRSSTLREEREEFGTSNEGAWSECNFELTKKERGFDDHSNQIHMMTARSDDGISKEEQQMKLDQTVLSSGGIGCNRDGDTNSFFKWNTIRSHVSAIDSGERWWLQSAVGRMCRTSLNENSKGQFHNALQIKSFLIFSHSSEIMICRSSHAHLIAWSKRLQLSALTARDAIRAAQLAGIVISLQGRAGNGGETGSDQVGISLFL